MARALKQKLCLPDRNHVARCRTHTSRQRSSWVPRTRKHIFAKVKLRSEGDLESWMKTFPDPSNSDPAYYAHTLVFRGTTTDPWAGGLIRTFSRAVRLRLAIPESLEELDSLAPFHKLSHSQVSPCVFSLPVLHANSQLRLFVPPSRRFNLVWSRSVIG